jgi:hypothetical protein
MHYKVWCPSLVTTIPFRTWNYVRWYQFIESRGRVVAIPALYSGGPGLKSRSGQRLSWLRLLKSFLGSSRKMPEHYFKLGHDCFLLHIPSKFIIIRPNHPIIRSYIDWATDSVVEWINKMSVWLSHVNPVRGKCCYLPTDWNNITSWNHCLLKPSIKIKRLFLVNFMEWTCCRLCQFVVVTKVLFEIWFLDTMEPLCNVEKPLHNTGHKTIWKLIVI